MALADITAQAVEQAIQEYDETGREAFLEKYGFGRASTYLLERDGKRYDSKAVVGAAHGYLPGQAPLRAGQFSGGRDHAAAVLRRLGFAVRAGEPAARDAGVLRAIEGLKVSRKAGRPLLYQPITLLIAIGRARLGKPRLLPWSETEKVVSDLLRRFGTNGERPRADYPVAALHQARLWTLEGHSGAVPNAHGDSTLRRWFAEQQPKAGLTEVAYEAFHRSGEIRLTAIGMLIDRYFDGLEPEALLSEVGLYDDGVGDDTAGPESGTPISEPSTADYAYLCRMAEGSERRNHGRRATSIRRTPIRSAWARRAVLHRADGACENPGCTGQPDDEAAAGGPLLEVDHIVEIARGGRDHPSQMAALCPNCHAIRTRGMRMEELRAVLQRVIPKRHEEVHRLSLAG